MIHSRIVAPLSPPSSPRMSGQDYKPAAPSWQQQDQRSGYGQGYAESGQFQASHGQAQGSSLRSYRTSPYPLNAQFNSHGVSSSAYPVQAQSNNEHGASSRSNPGHHPSSAPLQQGFVTSVPGSPASRISPKSEGLDEQDDLAEDDDPDASGEPEDEEGKHPISAAEMRNQKRKMKRFRLTHNQTRFLMSEFARQAHPDAAHRERLSREIPGLSPRQVQVWFQNRRAKLKRLTAEDRERMMRSRALPENFDMTPSLHGAFAPGSASATPGASPASFETGLMSQPGHPRTLTLDTLRRSEHGGGYMSAGMTPGMGSIFTPPQSATDAVSPGLSGPEMTSYGFPQRPVMDSPRGPLYRHQHPSAPAYPPQYPQASRQLAGHDRFRRQSGESASSPLRSSISYDSINAQSGQTQEARSSGMSNEPAGFMPQHEAQRNMPPPSGAPYGLGFSYYPPNVRPPQPPTTAPHNTELIQSYQRDSQQTLSQHPQAFPEYQNFQVPPYSAPQVPQYGLFAGQYGQPGNAYNASYVPRPEQQHSSLVPGSMAGQPPSRQLTHTSGESEGDTSDGGVPISTSAY